MGDETERVEAAFTKGGDPGRLCRTVFSPEPSTRDTIAERRPRRRIRVLVVESDGSRVRTAPANSSHLDTTLECFAGAIGDVDPLRGRRKLLSGCDQASVTSSATIVASAIRGSIARSICPRTNSGIVSLS